jgi:hypothetical protein
MALQQAPFNAALQNAPINLYNFQAPGTPYAQTYSDVYQTLLLAPDIDPNVIPTFPAMFTDMAFFMSCTKRGVDSLAYQRFEKPWINVPIQIRSNAIAVAPVAATVVSQTVGIEDASYNYVSIGDKVFYPDGTNGMVTAKTTPFNAGNNTITIGSLEGDGLPAVTAGQEFRDAGPWRADGFSTIYSTAMPEYILYDNVLENSGAYAVRWDRIQKHQMQRKGNVIPGGWGTKIDSMGDAVLPGEFGRILRAPSLRLLTAADEFFKTLAAITEGHALAWREATNEGLTGEEREKRIEALMHGPTSHIHERALVAAKRLTFQGERGPLARSVLAARSAVNDAMPGAFPLGSILLPFVGTPTAIFEEAIGLPFHPIKTTYKAIAAALGKPYEGGKAQGVEDAARSAIAIGFMLAALALAYDDDEETGLPRITGAAPGNAGDRELAYRTAPPMSVRIGSTYYGYGQLEPVGTMLGAMVDAGRKFREEGTGAAFGAFVRSIPPIAADKTYLETVGEIYKIAQAQGDISDKLARMSLYTFVTPMMPNILRSGARSTDDVMRANPVRKYDDAGLWEATARSLPYQALPVESIAPPPKYDLWGRPVEKQAAWFSRLVNPAAATQNVENVLDVDLLLRNYQARFERGEIKDNGAKEITPTSPDYSFTYKGERHYMTDAEYERLQRDAGQLALRSLKGEFSPLQVRSPEWEDVRKIADEIRSAREIVRNRIINDRRRKGAL